jgi:hypothetical protein
VLKHVSAVLAELKLVTPAQPLRYYLNLTTGEAMSISAFASADAFFQIKASELVDLEPEYAAYQRAWADFPDFVPRPLGYATRDRWRIMISEGVAHKPFPARLVAAYDDARETGPTSDLLRFFETGRQHARTTAAAPHGPLLDALHQHFAQTPYVALAARWLEHARQHAIQSLPQAAQHGDFVLNNLALSGARLVVFDWEDYGRVTLQGLDLATLAVSVWGHEPGFTRAFAQGAGGRLDAPMAAFLRRACALSGIEFELFCVHIPLYVLVFLYLKRNYGKVVQQRIGDLLQHLSA